MAVEAFIKIVQGQMRHPGREVVMRGFGTFKAKLVPARTGRNPQTGAPVEIPEHIKVIFKPSKVAKNGLTTATAEANEHLESKPPTEDV